MRLLALCCLLLSAIGRTGAQTNLSDSTVCERNCCCVNDPTPAGVMISHVHLKREWMISYRYMSMAMAGIRQGNTEVEQHEVLRSYLAAPDRMQMDMHMLMAMYGITNKLTLMGMLHYTSSYMEMTMPVGKNYHRHSMTTSGVGDTKLYALYALKKGMFSQALFNAGLSLPTGSINRKGPAGAMMFPNQRYPYVMQPGSGTLDLLPGFTYLTQTDLLSFSAQIQTILRTGYNTYGYKPGNEATFNCWGAWQWLRFISSSLRLEGNFSGKVSGKDPSLDTYTEISANPSNYGGRRLSAYAGTNFQPKSGLFRKNRLSVEYGIPLYQNLNGVQMGTTGSLYLSWSLTF